MTTQLMVGASNIGEEQGTNLCSTSYKTAWLKDGRFQKLQNTFQNTIIRSMVGMATL
jgi:hypothetical protein